jgi:hypothetical protein
MMICCDDVLQVAVIATVDQFVAVTSSPGPNVVINRGFNLTTAQMVQATVRRIRLAEPSVGPIVWLSSDTADINQLFAQEGLDIDVVLTSRYVNSVGGTMPAQPLVVDTYLSTPQFPDKVVLGGIVQRRGSTAGYLRMVFDSTGTNLLPSLVTGGLVLLSNSSVSPNTGNVALWTNTQQASFAADASLGNTIAFVNSTVFGQPGSNLSVGLEGCRFADCPMGRMVADMALDWCPRCDLAIYNAGSIRASFAVGNVSRLDVFSVLPFGNNLVSFTITGTNSGATIRIISHPHEFIHAQF